jgi:D-xylose reductase
MLKFYRKHAKEMAYAQRDAWGLDYIDLFLIHFPVALKYIEPTKLQYPVCSFEGKHHQVLTRKFLGLVDGRGPHSRRA